MAQYFLTIVPHGLVYPARLNVEFWVEDVFLFLPSGLLDIFIPDIVLELFYYLAILICQLSMNDAEVKISPNRCFTPYRANCS